MSVLVAPVAGGQTDAQAGAVQRQLSLQMQQPRNEMQILSVRCVNITKNIKKVENKKKTNAKNASDFSKSQNNQNIPLLSASRKRFCLVKRKQRQQSIDGSHFNRQIINGKTTVGQGNVQYHIVCFYRLPISLMRLRME